MSYTFVIMSVPKAVYSVVRGLLASSFCEHAINPGSAGEAEVLDMRGIALAEDTELKAISISGVGSDQPYAVSTEAKWRYDQAPRGAKIFLLTKGGVAVDGYWRDDGSFIAWQLLFKRDKELELLLGIPQQ